MKKKTLVFMMIDILIGKMIFNCLILFLIAYDILIGSESG